MQSPFHRIILSLLNIKYYDSLIGDCSNEERAMFAQQQTHTGTTDLGVGVTNGGPTIDAAWAAQGSFNSYMIGSSWRIPGAYAFLIR